MPVTAVRNARDRITRLMSDYHEAHFQAGPHRTGVWKVIASHLAPWVPPDASVVDIGAGYCDWINHVRAARRLAVDIWPGVARHAAPGVQTALLDVATGLRTLGDASFDVVLASNVLEHFPPETTASIAGDIAAILKPGGRLIVIQPNFKYAWRTYFDDYTHRSVFTDVSLPALLRSTGLAIEHVEPKFMPYSMQGTLFRPRPWLVRAYLHSPVRPRAGQMLVVARKG